MSTPGGQLPPEDPGTSWVTVAEAAEVMRVSRMTVYRLIQARQLPAARFGRSLRIAHDDLETYLRQVAPRPGEARSG